MCAEGTAAAPVRVLSVPEPSLVTGSKQIW